MPTRANARANDANGATAHAGRRAGASDGARARRGATDGATDASEDLKRAATQDVEVARVVARDINAEIARRARETLGIIEDVDEAWAAHGAVPERGARAAREAWVQCERDGCGKWRRCPRRVALALGSDGRFFCKDSRDGRFNSCSRAQEATDEEIDAALDESMQADFEAELAARNELTRERNREYGKRKRAMELSERAARGEIEIHEDGTWTLLKPKKSRSGVRKIGKNGGGAHGGAKKTKLNGQKHDVVECAIPPHPGHFEEWSWIQCESAECGKWRKVQQSVVAGLMPRDRWICAMNVSRDFASCDAPQELGDEEITAFMAEQQTRLLEHNSKLAHYYAYYAKKGGAPPPGVKKIKVYKTITEQPTQVKRELPPPPPVVQKPKVPFDEGPEDPESWVPGTPRPIPPPAVRGTVPPALAVVCNNHQGVFLPKRTMFRCHCEQPEHMCGSVSGEGDGRIFTPVAWEAHCGRAATKKWRNSVKCFLQGPVPRLFMGHWIDEVGLEIAGARPPRDPNAPPRRSSTKKMESSTVMVEFEPSVAPGPINQLSLRNLMTVFGFILDGSAVGEAKVKNENEDGEEGAQEVMSEKERRTAAEKELGRLASVCKAWRCASLTVLKAAGVAAAAKQSADGGALRTQFNVITEYLDRADDKECQVERSVTLDKDHPFENGSKTKTRTDLKDGKPPGWWPSLGTKAPRKKLKTEVIEQETYGVDFVTGRDATDTLKRVLPDFSEEEVWALYKRLLAQVNASYGAMTPDTLATQSLALAAEDLAEQLERQPGSTALAHSKALWALSMEARQNPELYFVHRKGFGVTCKTPIKKGEFLVDFLGEIYPPWAWAEKQDAIRQAQKARGLRDRGPPEFYNMQIERPGGDAEGYSVLFCDAMHENNYAARLSHSCDPNVEVNLKAINGKYEIHFITTRDILPGEELAYNYHSCTDSMKEVEQAFCLCGARLCRGSYLSFVGENNHSQVLNAKHRLIDRQVMLFKALADADKPLRPRHVEALATVGFYPGKGLLKNCPGWLLQYVGSVAAFMQLELKELPKHIIKAAEQDHEKMSKKNPTLEFTYTEDFAKIDALAMRENRTQCLAIMLSKIRRLMTRARDGSEQKSVVDCMDMFAKADAPYRAVSDVEVAAMFWGTSQDDFHKSIVSGLIQAMAPHMRKELTDMFASWSSKLEDVALKVRGGKMNRRDSLILLRDALKELPQTSGARHDLAAGLVHLYAITENFWIPSDAPEHQLYKSDVVHVREDEVNAWGVGAEGAGTKIVAKIEKTYRPGFTAATLLQWHKQEQSDPTQHMFANRKGNLTLPDLACCYSSRPGVRLPRADKMAHETWIAHLQSCPDETWPASSGPWGPTNVHRLTGTPILDAWMRGKKEMRPVDIKWLKDNTGEKK